jgi:hypothetical protein
MYLKETDSGSSGSFETSFGGSMIKRNFHPFYPLEEKTKKRKKKKKMKNITLSEIENIALKALIFEEVYSEKPVEPKGKEISTKNIKQEISSSKPAKTTQKVKEKSGKEHTSDVKGRTDKVKASIKNNLKGAEVEDVNKDKKVDDDYEVEAYQNGMEDIAYERISDKQKQKIKDQISAKGSRKDPNAEKSGKVAKKMIDGVKKRDKSKANNPFNRLTQSGSDIEYTQKRNESDSNPTKKTAMANENTIKRLSFKRDFESTKDMLERIPSNYKSHEKIFEMFDGNNKYKIRWEGNSINGTGVILEHYSEAKEDKMYDMFNKLVNNSMDNEYNSSTLNENNIFKSLLNSSREING